MPKKHEVINKGKDYHDDHIEFLKDAKKAAAYLDAALEEGNSELFLLALRNVAEAQGGLLKISKKTKLNRANLYRMLSRKGNPEFFSLDSLLEAFGLRLAIEVRA
jgi:probable addiction module antidote protein